MREHFERNASTYAWLGLGVSIAVYDYLSPKGQTLSEGVDRALEHPVMKYVAYSIGGVVAGHLFNVIPDEYDPIHSVAEAVGKQ